MKPTWQLRMCVCVRMCCMVSKWKLENAAIKNEFVQFRLQFQLNFIRRDGMVWCPMHVDRRARIHFEWWFETIQPARQRRRRCVVRRKRRKSKNILCVYVRDHHANTIISNKIYMPNNTAISGLKSKCYIVTLYLPYKILVGRHGPIEIISGSSVHGRH